MTVPERLSASPVSIKPSPRRALARNAEVRSNSDKDPDYPRPKTQNRSAFSPETSVPAPRTFAPQPSGTLQTICRTLKSHR